ncbi:unnamed protein product [Lota lota]
MGIKEVKPISKIFSWIFIFNSLNFCPGIHSVGLVANNKVHVALSGETVHLEYQVNPQVNQSEGTMQCFSPNQVVIQEGNPNPRNGLSHLTIVNVTTSDSGIYHCGPQGEMAEWYLQVRDNGYKAPWNQGLTIVGVFTVILGISSIAGSLYLLKEHVPSVAKCGGWVTEGEAREGREEHEDPDPQGATATSPADVYASLEARPGSIYDMLEHSTARQDTGPVKAASGSSQGTKETPHDDQNQGVFEGFYENL